MFREFPRPQRFRVKKGLTAEQGHEADCRQPPLRARFRQQVSASVRAPSEAWRFLWGGSPHRVRSHQPPVPSVAYV